QLSSSLRSKILRPNLSPLYQDTKQGATEYQTAKACLFKAFLKAGLGAWVEKLTEQDQFSLTV
ncbi:RED1 editase, partial [Spelaeornis formosus]|nr:RED1 editase [Elachura formosa]